jgi:hypothetical protein
VKDTAIVASLVATDVRFLLEQDDFGVTESAPCLESDRQPHDSAAYDDYSR